MKKKYDIHSDFAILNALNLPINKATVGFLQTVMSVGWAREKGNDEVDVQEFEIDFHGTPVKILVYSPVGAANEMPCLVYLHGGAFVLPTAPYHFANARKYALGARCRVVMVDYPLAPRFKHPVQMEACFEAFKWVVKNAKKLGINPQKIALAGDSAGGGLCAAMCILAHEAGMTKPCGQMLMYPLVVTQKQTASMKEFTHTPVCNSRAYAKYETYFFEGAEDKNDPYVQFLYYKHFGVFPESYIETAEFDCLRDGALEFAKRLKSEGIPTTVVKTKGTVHAFDMIENSAITRAAIAGRIEFLNKVFGRS